MRPSFTVAPPIGRLKRRRIFVITIAEFDENLHKPITWIPEHGICEIQLIV